MLNSSETIYDVHLDDFDKKVLQASHERPVIVDFWAEWCSPCLVIDPVLREVVSSYAGKVALARLEVDEGDNMKLAGRYQVRGFPTIILFHNAEVMDRFSSARPKQFIDSFISKGLEAV
jgi:putative thioredoxin